MKGTKARMAAAVLALGVMGCGKSRDTAWVEATPDFDGLALEISGVAAESGGLTSARQDGLGEGAPHFLREARQGIAHLNAQVRRVIAPIAELVNESRGTTAAGDAKVYGPKDRGNASYRLTISRQAANKFGWRLEAKALGADDSSFVTVAGGFLVKGEQPHRGRGALGVDLDALRAVDTSVVPQGKVLCGFAHVGESKTLSYRLKGFTPDAAVHAPMDAAFVGHRVMPSGATAVRLVTLADIHEDPTKTLQELVRARVRYLPGTGGRADVLATGGDVPVGKVLVGTACWDAQETEGFYALRLCEQGKPLTCQLVRSAGVRSNCALGADVDEPPGDNPLDASPEADAPSVDVEAPTSMPVSGP